MVTSARYAVHSLLRTSSVAAAATAASGYLTYLTYSLRLDPAATLSAGIVTACFVVVTGMLRMEGR